MLKEFNTLLDLASKLTGDAKAIAKQRASHRVVPRMDGSVRNLLVRGAAAPAAPVHLPVPPRVLPAGSDVRRAWEP